MSEPGEASKAPPQKPAPARPLPSGEDIAAWTAGEDVPLLGALFDKVNLKRFDTLVTLIRKEELLPQHWQVIRDHSVADDGTFDRLPEVRRLRLRYKNQELSRRRLAALRVAWRELGGKQPSLWTAADLFAALRRIFEKGLEVDFYELLTATRDVWDGLTLPHGREQLEILWNCLALIRSKTKA